MTFKESNALCTAGTRSIQLLCLAGLLASPMAYAQTQTVVIVPPATDFAKYFTVEGEKHLVTPSTGPFANNLKLLFEKKGETELASRVSSWQDVQAEFQSKESLVWVFTAVGAALGGAMLLGLAGAGGVWGYLGGPFIGDERVNVGPQNQVFAAALFGLVGGAAGLVPLFSGTLLGYGGGMLFGLGSYFEASAIGDDQVLEVVNDYNNGRPPAERIELVFAR